MHQLDKWLNMYQTVTWEQVIVDCVVDSYIHTLVWKYPLSLTDTLQPNLSQK